MSRVLARFQAPTFVPDPTRSKVSETVAYGVAREADTVLHQLQSREDEEEAAKVSEAFKRRLEPAIKIYTEETLEFIERTRENLRGFERIWERHSFRVFRRRRKPSSPSSPSASSASASAASSAKSLPNSEKVVDEIISVRGPFNALFLSLSLPLFALRSEKTRRLSRDATK